MIGQYISGLQQIQIENVNMLTMTEILWAPKIGRKILDKIQHIIVTLSIWQ